MVVIPSHRSTPVVDKEFVVGAVFCFVMGVIAANWLGQVTSAFDIVVLTIATVGYGVGLVYNLSALMTRQDALGVEVARRS